MTDMEKELMTAAAKAVNEMGAQRPGPPLKAIEQPLVDQIGKMEGISRQLRERIRRDLLAAQYDYLQLTDKLRNEHERHLAEDLRRATEAFNEKTRDLELLAKRLGV